MPNESIKFGIDLLPNTNEGYNLGSSSLKWNIFGNLTGSATQWTTAQNTKVILGTQYGNGAGQTITAINGGQSDVQTIAVDGTLGIENGGTGATSFTANSAIISGSTSTAALTTRGITDVTSAGNPSANTNLITANTLLNYTGTANISTVGTITDGVWNGTKINPNKGGTGLNNYSKGDILYAGAAISNSDTTALSKLSIGSAGQVLYVNSDVPDWYAGLTLSSTTSGNTTTYSALFGGTILGASGSGIYHLDGAPELYFLKNNNTNNASKLGSIFLDVDTTNSVKRTLKMYFSQYSYNTSTGAQLTTRELYCLPEVDGGLASNATYPIMTDKNYRKDIFANKNRSLSTLTVTNSTWAVIPSGSTDVFGLSFKDTGLTYTPSGGTATASSDTGDWRAWLTCAADSNSVNLNMRIDGSWQAGKFIGPLQGNADTATSSPRLSIIGTNTEGTDTNLFSTAGLNVRWYSATSKISGQPTQYGFLFTVGTSDGGNEVHQIWVAQANSNIYHRGTNTSSHTDPPAFKTLLDSSNYTSWCLANTNTGSSDRPIYISNNAPTQTTYRMCGTNATATTALAITDNLATGIWYVNGTNSTDLYSQSDGVCYAEQYNTSWIHEIYGDYRTGQIAVRAKNNGTWQAWRKVLDSSNYTNYTVTKTGTGASGSWGISVTGTAAAISNIGSGDAASSTATNRYVWFSYDNNTTGRPAYSTNFTYQTSTNTLSAGTHLLLSGATTGGMAAGSTNPHIEFVENGTTQPVYFIYTDQDSYRKPAGLKVIGGTSATPAWLEVEGDFINGGAQYCNYNNHTLGRHGQNLACYATNSSTVTGTFKIKLPDAASNSVMMVVRIIVYEYNSNAGSEITLSGYCYSGDHKWHNYSASIVGTYNRGVRLAYDGTNYCILLGTTSTQWAYPQVHLVDVYSGYQIQPEQGYTITLITSESGFTLTGSVATHLRSDKVYSAVWNDYAEYRQTITEEPGRVCQENDNGRMTLVEKRLVPGCSIISDTFGYAEGETEKAKTPVAVSGRVLAYTYRDRSEYHAGMAVCSAPNGTVDIMSRDEIMMYPDAIIGIVSEIPDYEEWGSGNVKVNGRIWIKIK